MAFNYQTAIPLILAKLDTITALQDAYDYHTENTTGYPYATFEPSTLGSVVFTTNDNLRELTFDIFIYSEMTKAGRRNAVQNLAVAVDAVVTALESDHTIADGCGALIQRALNGEWAEFTNAAGPVKAARITFAIATEVDVL